MQKQSGFSLVELMVAMTVTLIVSAAIYGLLTSGSNAFRREPEIADRQQNIRIAMDLITRDVFNAGASLPPFAQVFTIADLAGGACTAGLNGCGLPGTLGSAAATARGGDSTDADVLEILTTSESCPLRPSCTGTTVTEAWTENTPPLFVPIREPVGCLTDTGLVLLADHDNFTIQPVIGGVDGDYCGGANGRISLDSPMGEWNTLNDNGGEQIGDPFVAAARVVRYAIAPSTDPTETAPALWRSTRGQYAPDGATVINPGVVDADSPWELVARGIEDLQIEYRAGDGVWRNTPPQWVNNANSWEDIVREVRITLSARASAPEGTLQGATSAEGGPDAVRGQLTTVVAPRAALNDLQIGGQIQ